VFFSTQYIRHHSVPLYTPEPDIVHELLGHAPMFADPDFADFSHEIGLASLGASDDDIKKLATCYWFSVEFGLTFEGGERKAYGAGLLSSFGELEYAATAGAGPDPAAHGTPEYRPWDPRAAATQPYPITKYQPVYYVASSLADAKAAMRAYCDGLSRPFHVRYDAATESVVPDRAVTRGPYTVTLQK
jgi:phenylalanine-4-hydroxylase